MNLLPSIIKRKHLFVIPIALFLVAMSNSLYATEIYKCTDADGSIRFQQAPCGSAENSVAIKSSGKHKDKEKPTDNSIETRLQKQKQFTDAIEQERRIKAEEQQKIQKEIIRAKKNCTRAKDSLARFERARGVYRLDNEGRKVYGDEAQRQQAINELKRASEYWCGKAGR